MIAIGLSKKQPPDADPKTIQEINFAGNLIRQNTESQNINENAIMFFINEEAKETILDFLQGTVKVFWMRSTILFCPNLIST